MSRFSFARLLRAPTVAKAAGASKARNRILAAITAAGTVTGVAAMAVSITGPNEGLKLVAYKDRVAQDLQTAKPRMSAHDLMSLAEDIAKTDRPRAPADRVDHWRARELMDHAVAQAARRA